MKYVWMVCLLLTVCGCNTVKEDYIVQEDYDKLFPSKEIERPENRREQFLVQLCDPNLILEKYKYPGTVTPDDAEQYKVTLTCVFEEKDWDGSLVERIASQYEVKYINEKKELVIISCGRNTGTSQSSPHVMYNGEVWEVSFQVQSGFPLYLSVSGEGPRNSGIRAEIKASSADGLLEVPSLKTEQYQNSEGINPLEYPYCEYIVLP